MKQLFTSAKMGKMELRNRIVMPAMHLGYSEKGFVTEKLIDFYRERSNGGAGLIIVGGCSIDEHGHGNMIRVDSDDFLPGLKKLVTEVQKGGAKIAAQLYQPGRYSFSYMHGVQPVAPSPVPSKLTGQTPRELSEKEVEEMIEKFAAAAYRVKEAGFDAVEVIASAGYLISQFLSPITNQRNDKYGGEKESRMRFGIETAKRIREVTGENYPLIFRVSGNEYMKGGNTSREMAEFCKYLEDSGVDAINVTGGWHETRVPQITMGVPRGTFSYLARDIKRNTGIPVIACNRINDPVTAEEVLQEGFADFVGMARGLIADPQMPEKAEQGRDEDIRPCIGCNQGCLDSVFSFKPVKCLVNAAAGKEKDREIYPAGKQQKILVAGGGPAGMEAARVLALRGHKVTLWESSDRLGGQLNLASVPPGREEFTTLAGYLEKQLEKQENVDVKTGVTATPQKIKEFGPDQVIIATGGTPVIPPVPGGENQNVFQAWDVLSGKVDPGEKTVIVGGGAVGCETALYLAYKGTLSPEQLYFLMINGAESPEKMWELATTGSRDITLLEMQKHAGADMGISTRWTILQDMKRRGIKIMTGTTVQEIKEDRVIVEVSGENKEIEADSVILAAGTVSQNDLYERIKDEMEQVYLVGDAYEPRKAMDAVHRAYELAINI